MTASFKSLYIQSISKFCSTLKMVNNSELRKKIKKQKILHSMINLLLEAERIKHMMLLDAFLMSLLRRGNINSMDEAREFFSTGGSKGNITPRD